MSQEIDVDHAPPRPAALIESLRAFGYDAPTAIADLIDNSVAAGARNVWVDFLWNGRNSVVTIRDDGRGMSGEELVAALRIGSRSPVEPREPRDLGRFGLGLKTASFSQCRVLTVASKLLGAPLETRTWDLDFVCKRDDWLLLRDPPAAAKPAITLVENQSCGTVVIWTTLDRMVGNSVPEDRVAEDAFYRTADQIRAHLAMVFGDFLRGRGMVVVHVSGHPVTPWDPFLIGHDATQELPMEPLVWKGEEIQVRPYVLPHHTRLAQKEWDLAAGANGWNAHQGFYVYRNRRMLVAGDWLGLGFTKEEHHKLARIRIDLTSGSDFQWALDVKKSRAWPPPELRAQLKRVAKLTRARASEVYRHRGRKLVTSSDTERVLLWNTLVKNGRTFYRLNRKHPIVAASIQAAGDPTVVKALLRLVEETVPVPHIYITNAEQPHSHAEPFEGVSSTQIRAVMQRVFDALIAAGHSAAEARRTMAHMDPFDRFPELLETLISGAEHADIED
jgi:hypothetical protein